MSGVEILGLAASVIQIAELGGKLSVQLFTFTRKVKSANKSIDALSQELASTGAVLKQLGETLTKDEHLRVCSQDAILTARGLVDDTNKVFTNLQKVVEGDEKSNEKFLKGISFKQRLKFPFLESQIEQVQANLERLKSSLLVILNVLIFAEQLRNQKALPILKDQRELIKVLVSEKDENEKRYQRILAAITDKSHQDGTKGSIDLSASPKGSITSTFGPLSTATTMISPDPESPTPQPTPKEPAKLIMLPSVVLPTGLQRHHERIHHHSYLVQNLLSEIASLQYNLDLSTRDRMQNDILNMHWEEWSTYRLRHGHEHFEKMLGVHPDVASYWTDRLQDHYARQLETAEVIRTRQSRVSSVSSTTSNPEKRTPMMSMERTAKADDLLVDTNHNRLASVSDPDADTDEFDSEAAFGLAAMAALDRKKSASEQFATLRKPIIFRGGTPSDISMNDDLDYADFSLNNIGHRGPIRAESISDLEDDDYGDEAAQAIVSRSTSITRTPEVMSPKSEEEADTSAIKQEIRFVKQKEVLPTRNALQAAAMADETDRNTLGRLSDRDEWFQTTGMKQNISSVNVESSDSSERGSLISVDSLKTRDPKRNAVSLLIEPASTTSLNLRSQLHKHSGSADAAMTSQHSSDTSLGISTATLQHSSTPHDRLPNTDPLSAHNKRPPKVSVAPSRSTLSDLPQQAPTQSPASTSGRPQVPRPSEGAPSTNTFYTKARIRYISPEVLEWEQLPWLYDPIDKDYLIVKQFLRKPELDQLSQQTQVLRSTRGDKISGANINSEIDVGSPKLKDVFVVIPAPLYTRFSGKLEYETCDTKRGDEKNPLFIKFEVEGARKGLLSKAKKKSMFYKSINVEIPGQRSPGQQQFSVKQRPVPPSPGTSAPDRLSLDEDIERANQTLDAAVSNARSARGGFLKRMVPKSSNVKVDSTEISNSGPNQPQLLTDTKQNNPQTYVQFNRMQSAAHTELSPNMLALSNAHSYSYSPTRPPAEAEAFSPQSAAHSAAPSQDRYNIPPQPLDRYDFYAPPSYNARASVQSSTAQGGRLAPYQRAETYEQASQEAITPTGAPPPPSLSSEMSSTHHQRQNDNKLGSPNNVNAPENAATVQQRNTLAERAKYQFEADSDDEAMENEIAYELGDAAKRLSTFGRAMGAELDAQNRTLQKITNKSDRLDGDISLNTQRLKRIDGREKKPTQALGSGSELNSSPSATAPHLRTQEEGTKKLSTSPEVAEKVARLKAIEERITRDEEEAAVVSKLKEGEREKNQREEKLLLDYQEALRMSQRVMLQEDQHAQREDIVRAERSRPETGAGLRRSSQASEQASRQSLTPVQGRATSQKQKQNAVFKVGDSGFVSMHLQSTAEKKSDLDDIDKLILQFSSLDEGEYVEQYKSVA